MTSSAPYPLFAARTLALHAQGLTTPNGSGLPPTPDAIYNIVERLGCVQIDTLHMVQRSHYLVPWSRLGAYNPKDYDRLAYDPAHRRLFEGWQRCASLIPLKDFRYQMPHMDRLRIDPGDWYRRWLTETGHSDLPPLVLERIRQEGAVRAADFEYKGPRRNSWWDWKPAKAALEYLYAFGELMISDRVNFQRVYDLTERILPDWVDQTAPTIEERDRFWIEQGARALGICTPQQAADYSYRKRNNSRPILESLHADQLLVPVQAILADGKPHDLIVHRDTLPLLEQAASGALTAGRTTFLSPFDSLFWARGRDEQLWNFQQRLEAYKPASTRIWGYYCLAILHGEQLVGRFDPKLERKDGLLRLKALYLEPGLQPSEELVAAVAAAMRDFLAFHHAKDLVIERSEPIEFGEKLLAVM
jgi:uncharacterized protein YcaQ